MSAAQTDQTPVSFGERLDGAIAANGRLCVGIDPHPYLLDAWGLPTSADGARSFGLAVVEAAAGRVGVVKPQVAFFEAYGSAGFAALEEVLAAARAAGLLVIGDALTVTAFTGVGALGGLFDRAEANGKGVFVLSATSNPESRALQTARTDAGATVSRLVADEVAARNTDRTRLGDFGLVLGATKRLDDYGFTNEAVRALSTTPVLAPGFGFQGAEFSELTSVFGPLAPNVVVAVSRSILQHGAAGLADAIDADVAHLAGVAR